MPRGDRTGPAGMGQMTGRGAGYCAGYTVPGFTNPVAGGGYGVGFGRGLGLGFRGGRGGGRGGRWGVPNAGYGYAAPFAVPCGAAPTREREIDSLQGQAKYFEDALAEIKKRLGNLETEKSGK